MTDKQWLLTILKRGAGDRSVEKCEILIVDPEVGGTEEEEDSLESKLIIRMYCKHGRLPICSVDHRRRLTIFRCGEDTQTSAAHNRVSPPVYR